MGVVYQVETVPAREVVALKLCFSDDDSMIKRFAREVRFMASVNHPHVMQVISQNTDYLPAYFTMPLAQQSISAEIIKGLSEEETLNIFKQICLGVQAIHNAGGTHRDIKPDNIMRMMDGNVVISDFGLIKLDPRDTTTLTQTAAFLGTRVYCAPEQLIPGGSRGADARTDVYQLGKTLYEMLTKETPALIERSKIPSGLTYIIEKATQQQPDNRYQSVGSLLDAVLSYVSSKSPGASPDQEYELIIQEITGLAERGQYQTENLEKLMVVLLRFAGEPETFIEQFDRIPREVLPVLARHLSPSLHRVLVSYRQIIESAIGNYSFSYAEVVANKMKAIFDHAEEPSIKAAAIAATLIAAVKCNRFAAMDVFSSMITSIRKSEDAIAIADILNEEIGYYEVIASQVPRSKIHAAIRRVYDAAVAKG
ncbi:putative Serine/threonine protein kinase [Nitrospira japonica]|uniref:Putative Serine/threonine protein kinase n=1 Tax=Nitrospira japonica TaxID=1325564 RepID=A0A1W1I9W8_9BACT|nr:serine/threonine-protein kinase [Nitrospira japonica]SLM49782.1 putative Serine/threonine protein kinase [Nitrospira japonica]